MKNTTDIRRDVYVEVVRGLVEIEFGLLESKELDLKVLEKFNYELIPI